MEIKVAPSVPKSEDKGLKSVIVDLVQLEFSEDDVVQSGERDLFTQNARDHIKLYLQHSRGHCAKHHLRSLSMRCDQLAKQLDLLTLAIDNVEDQAPLV